MTSTATGPAAAMPRVRILSSGSEILQGLYADTNARDLSQRLLALGFRVVGHRAAPDDFGLLVEAIDEGTREGDLMVMTGGLGPTGDDLTRDAVARVYGVRLLPNDSALAMMRRRFEARGIPVPENNYVQAQIPEGADVLLNHWGTAPGFLLPGRDGRAALLALPGPPREWQPMFDRAVADHLDPRFPGRPRRFTRTLHVAMVPESLVDQALRSLFDADPNLEFTLLAKRGMVRVRMVGAGAEEAAARALVERFAAEARERLGGEMICADGPETITIQEVVVGELKDAGRTLALAESCTGGLVAARVTDVAGASDVLRAGYVPYTVPAKVRDLGVPESVAAVESGVSEACACALAKGARSRAGADYGLAITGVAGPGGGTEANPVGTVWFAVAGEWGVRSIKRRFPGDREAIRDWASNQALEFLRRAHRGYALEFAFPGAANP